MHVEKTEGNPAVQKYLIQYLDEMIRYEKNLYNILYCAF